MPHVSRTQRRALGYKGHRRERTAGFLSFLPLFTFRISSPDMSFYLFIYFFPPPLQVLLLPCGEVPSFARWCDESHGMPLVGGALSPLGCLRSHVRLMYQSPRDSFALWLEQPTIHPNYGGPHHRTYTHSSSLASLNAHTRRRAGGSTDGQSRTRIAKVMQQSHRLCHRASACLRPQRCFPMRSCSLSSSPFPLNTARSQPYFLISLFSLPRDS